jgi:hypothetical protein
MKREPVVVSHSSLKHQVGRLIYYRSYVFTKKSYKLSSNHDTSNYKMPSLLKSTKKLPLIYRGRVGTPMSVLFDYPLIIMTI